MAQESGLIMVFARDPVPGKTKTRLIPALGKTGAARLHKQLIKQTLITVSSCNTIPSCLYCMPTENSPFFQTCADDFGVLLKKQVGTDLGLRMFNAFEDALSSNSWALLIGTDCPNIVRADLMNAINYLQAGIDAVIGPAIDGGYYLIGLRKNDISLFSEMPWGTNHVFNSTDERMKALNWTIRRLPLYRDIDRPEDLESLDMESLSK